MNIEREIFEICEKVVENESSLEVDCSHISCEICPLSSVNRKNGMGCIVDDKETIRIAKEYIDKNKSYYKVKDIIKNIDMFEIGTKFSLYGKNILSIGENETIIFEGSMSNELDLNLVLKIERPKKERIVTFEELKVGDVFVLRTNKSVDSCQYEIISLVKEGLFVVQYIENNSEKYELFSNADINEILSIILIEG